MKCEHPVPVPGKKLFYEDKKEKEEK